MQIVNLKDPPKRRRGLNYETLPAIMDTVTEVTGISKNDLSSKKRYQEIVLARHIFHTVASELTNCNQDRIAIETRRERSTVSHSFNVTLDLLETDKTFRGNYEKIKATVKEKFNL